MARRPTASLLLPVARALLEEVAAEGFATAALRRAVAQAAPVGDRAGLARALVTAFLETGADLRAAPDLATHVVTLMTLLCPSEAVARAIAEQGQAAQDPETEMTLLTLADAAGMELPGMERMPPLPRPLVQTLLDTLAEGEEGHHAVLYELTAIAAPPRLAMLLGLLDALRDLRDAAPFVGLLAASPPDEASERLAERWLAKHGGKPGKWLLARLAGKPADAAVPAVWRALPLFWPVREAWLTFPDGHGTQVLALLRARPDGATGLALALVNDWRGFADAVTQVALPDAEARALMTTFAAGMRLVPVPAAYAEGRLAVAMQRHEDLALPLPLGLRASGGFFAGVADEELPDLWDLVAGWAAPAALPETGALLERPELAGWFPEDGDLAVTAPFWRDALAGTLPPIAPWLPRLYDAEARDTWAMRLARAAYLYDRLGEAEARRLAATAAQALRAESGVALADQPFPAALLGRAVAYRQARVGELGAFANSAAGDAPKPAKKPRAKAAPKAAGAKRGKPAAQAAATAKVYQLKITLVDAEPAVWRRVLVPADYTLDRLHAVIQAAMGWEDFHLHAFTIDGRGYGVGDDEWGTDAEDETAYQLAQVLGPRKRFVYEYDFGDSWRHELKVEKTLAAEAGRSYPACLEGAGACPPEDSGGVWGYAAKLAVLADPEDEEHAGVLEWMGEGWDPQAFDLAEANARLAGLA